jgi:hypothetical protein
VNLMRVTAPYVVLKVKDSSGVFVVRGVYKHAVFPVSDVDPDSLAHHVDGGMAEVFSDAPPAAVEPEPEAEPKKAAKKTAA